MRKPRLTCALVVDAEEDFEWSRPLTGEAYSTHCMLRITELSSLLSAYGLVPTYLVTWPVLQDDDVVRLLARQSERGECRIGLQMHSWVTPPLERNPNAGHSFACNLAPSLEAAKIENQAALFERRLGYRPTVFRSGRYGFGPSTGRILENLGFTVDTSLAPRTDFRAEGGPDFSQFDSRPFWFGESHRILEVPLCRSLVGWGGQGAANLYRKLDGSAPPLSLLAGSRCAERVTLSPEGNDTAAMKRLVKHLSSQGQNLLSISFHSSSLAPGRNPYVRTPANLRHFLDRLSALVDTLATSYDAHFTPVEEFPSLLLLPEAEATAASAA